MFTVTAFVGWHHSLVAKLIHTNTLPPPDSHRRACLGSKEKNGEDAST